MPQRVQEIFLALFVQCFFDANVQIRSLVNSPGLAIRASGSLSFVRSFMELIVFLNAGLC
jgi:hypothetical protein